MDKLISFFSLIVILLLLIPGLKAQYLSPVLRANGELSDDTSVIYFGQTSILGSFKGLNPDMVVNNSDFDELLDNSIAKKVINRSLIENLSYFPVFGLVKIVELDTVRVVDLEELLNIDTGKMTPVEILNYLDNIQSFSNVNIKGYNSLFLIGADENSIDVNTDLDFAISSIIQFEFEEDKKTSFLATVSLSEIKLEYNGKSSIFYKPYDSGFIVIEDFNGVELLNESSTGNLFIFEDENINYFIDSVINLFPISTEYDNKVASLSVFPASNEDIQISKIIEKVSKTPENVSNINITDFLMEFDVFEELLPTITSIVNGGMVLINSQDTILVEKSKQSFSDFGLTRGDGFDIEIYGGDILKTYFAGDYKLIFLGDHFYTKQAEGDKNGITFPWISVFFWLLAIAIYILFRYKIKTNEDIDLDKKIKIYSVILHIACLFVAFILMDREISFQFGISAIDAILFQGITILLWVLILFELILWVIGYIAMNLPIKLIIFRLLKLIGLEKSGDEISKGVSAFFIWIFCAIYVKVIINFLILFVNLDNFLPMG